MINGQIWYRCVCSCEKTNWIYIGYFPDNDLSKLDVDGFKCWSCGKENWFSDEEDFQFTINDGYEYPK